MIHHHTTKPLTFTTLHLSQGLNRLHSNHSHWRSIGTKHVNNGSIQCTIPHLVKGTSTVRVRPKCLNGGWFRESIHNYVPLERQSLLPLCHSQTNVSIQYQSVTNLWPICQSNANLKSICQFIINPSIRYRSWTNPAIHHQSITNPPIPRQTLTHLPICQSNELPIMDYSANPMQIPEWSVNPLQICRFKANPRPISDQSSLNPPNIVRSQVPPTHLAQYQQRTLKLSTLAPIGYGLSQVMPILGQSSVQSPT